VNHAVSLIFRAIPLAMMAVCVGFGVYVWTAGDASGNFVAGRVVTFLGVICLCLFCTAATIIRQLIGNYTSVDRVLYPSIGYLAAAGTAAYGAYLFVGVGYGRACPHRFSVPGPDGRATLRKGGRVRRERPEMIRTWRPKSIPRKSR
jgi:hypothetical protein